MTAQERALIDLATIYGTVAYPAAAIHGPFAVVECSDGWGIIHRPSGRLVTRRDRKAKGYRLRGEAEARIRELLRSPVDWRQPDLRAAGAEWDAWKAGAR